MGEALGGGTLLNFQPWSTNIIISFGFSLELSILLVNSQCIIKWAYLLLNYISFAILQDEYLSLAGRALTGVWSLEKAELGGEERQDLIAEVYV